MNNLNGRRMMAGLIAGVVVTIAVLIGVLSLVTMSSYNQGLADGMARGTQIVVPNSGAQMMPAPQPYVMQPQYYSRQNGWGGFSLIGVCFNVFAFLFIVFVITRIIRFAMGRRRWGNGAWAHGPHPGDWQKWHDWRNGTPHGDPRNAPNDFRNTPNKPDEQVI